LNSKAQIVGIVSAVIAIVVLSAITVTILGKFEIFGKQQTCQWTFLASAIAKASTVVGAQVIPPACKATETVITKKSINQDTDLGQRGIQELKKNRPKTYLASKANQYFTDPTNKAQQSEWAFDIAIAKEMKQCWDKVWQGKINAFNEWDQSTWNNVKAWAWNTPDDFENTAITTCVLCSTIHFSGDEPFSSEQKTVQSLEPFMRSAIVPLDRMQRTYYEYFTQSAEPQQPLIVTFMKEVPLYQSLAVMYVHRAKPKSQVAAEAFRKLVKENPHITTGISVGAGLLLAIPSGGTSLTVLTTLGMVGTGAVGGTALGYKAVSYLGWEGTSPATIDALDTIELVPFTDSGLRRERCQLYLS